jgi:hypothetical protein
MEKQMELYIKKNNPLNYEGLEDSFEVENIKGNKKVFHMRKYQQFLRLTKGAYIYSYYWAFERQQYMRGFKK